MDSIEKLLGAVMEDDRGLHALLKEMVKQTKAKQVAFSASLSVGSMSLGPYTEHTTIAYKNVLTNIGKAYNPETGVFTAPVKGAYQFQCHFPAGASDKQAAVGLFKNSELAFAATQLQKGGNHGSAGQSATMLLEAGDVVVVKLWNNTYVNDDQFHHNTFSGHMLFPM